jgi:hypothetical protein
MDILPRIRITCNRLPSNSRIDISLESVELACAKESGKSLGQELKLIKSDQHHQELLEKYDFLGFFCSNRQEDANANQRAARGIFAHTYQRIKIDRSRLLTGPCLSLLSSTPHSPMMQISIVENKVEGKSKRAR